MEIPRERRPMIEEAAKRSGYYPKEVAAIVEDPIGLLKYGERPEVLRFDPHVAEMFLRLIEGRETDWQAVVNFGARLRSLQPDSEKSRWSRAVKEDFSSRSVEGRRDAHGVELSFEEEQKLLLVKNLIEDAFFDGRLAELQGQSAAALAFLTNHLAKLVDSMTREVKDEFSFDETKMKWLNALLLERQVKANEVEKEALDLELEQLKVEKVITEEKIFTTDDPRVDDLFYRGVEVADLQAKLKALSSPDLQEERRIAEVIASTGSLVRTNFDVYLPEGFPNKIGIKQNIDRLMRGWGLNYDEEIFVKFINRVNALPASKKAPMQPLVDYVNYHLLPKPLMGTSGEINNVSQEIRRTQEAIEKERRIILESPKDTNLADKRDDIVLRIRDIEGRLRDLQYEKKLYALRDATSTQKHLKLGNTRDILHYKAPQPEADLYLIKNVLAAADMRGRIVGRDLELPKDKSDIATYRFTGTTKTEKGFADVHIRKSLMPLAETIVDYQLTVEDNPMKKAR
ncbi:TPA: hypothetical protein DEP96_04395 [Candidatus Uhrbacteria bacterium]|nr:hypothetical protein [Candidatus Uhrbacteria bacterium]